MGASMGDADIMRTEFPVVEIFGPTIQGEGRWAGMPCAFVRLGGCDYKCKWCDSMHAVDYAHKDEWAPMNAVEIVNQVIALAPRQGIRYVVITGGNPALHNLSRLLLIFETLLPDARISIETQGTIVKSGMELANLITVSPKPPSSGMRQPVHVVKRFINMFDRNDIDLKVVVFNSGDITYAREIMTECATARTQCFLSVGTRPDDTTETLLDRYRIIIDDVNLMWDAFAPPVQIMPQMHVLLWGHKVGV